MLKDGNLVEMGNHDEIIAKHPFGVYHGFVLKQQSAEKAVDEQDPDLTVDQFD